ncbi:MAG: hypothetical protein DI531_04130 [Brevundimonas sp.]|nr:MAG: hypothetical protein DI531_04130 [Brevundimonas sp.]
MLSKTEWPMLKQYAKDRVRRFDAEIENRLRMGDLRAAKHKARKMLACPAARLVALIRSNAKLKPTKRRDHAALIAEIGAVDVFRRAASPCMEWQPKPDRGSRPIYKFGLVDGACAALIAMALKPFARAHPRLACHPAQVLLAGGSPAACERLRSALEQAPDGAAFVHIDVRRFYQSMTCAGLARMTGLPPEVIHRHLSVEHLKVRARNSKEYPTGQENVDPGVRHSAPYKPERETPEVLSGLTTGSAASSTVAEIVMGHILRDARATEGLITLIVYSDNVGAVVRSQEAALVFKEAILRALRRSEAGPFGAGEASICDVRAGFNFLGYRWQKDGEAVIVEPTRHRHELWQIAFRTDLMEAGAGLTRRARDELRAQLRCYANGKREWEGRLDFVARYEALIDLVLPPAEPVSADLPPGR